jgi:hypothetical protein
MTWRNFEETRAMLIDTWEDLARRVPEPPKGTPKAEHLDNWLAEHSGIPAEDITTARRARNSADADKINLETMRRAQQIINKVNEWLHQGS